MEIKNSAAIITGGASGMGLATARMLKHHGAKITLLDMNEKGVKDAAYEIDGLGLLCNVTSREEVENAIHEANQKHGIAQIIVNCAGIVHGKRMVGRDGPMPLDEFRKVIEVNLIGTFNVMAIAAASMVALPASSEEERGVIINTASVAAFEGQIGQTAYSASKGGIVGMTLPAARELAQFGIRVMTIAPGLVDTPMFAKIGDEARASLAASVPFPKRLARPEEFAELAKAIIQNSMLNGEVIRLDGALRMQPK